MDCSNWHHLVINFAASLRDFVLKDILRFSEFDQRNGLLTGQQWEFLSFFSLTDDYWLLPLLWSEVQMVALVLVLVFAEERELGLVIPLVILLQPVLGAFPYWGNIPIRERWSVAIGHHLVINFAASLRDFVSKDLLRFSSLVFSSLVSRLNHQSDVPHYHCMGNNVPLCTLHEVQLAALAYTLHCTYHSTTLHCNHSPTLLTRYNQWDPCYDKKWNIIYWTLCTLET